MTDHLQGKIIIVTGAGGRLGQRMAQRFAEHGAVIAAIVRDREEAMRIPFPDDAEGWAFPADVTDEARVEACFKQIGEQFGHIDALVHTVGGWGSDPFLETSLEDWEKLVRMNLTSAFLCFREAARLMQGREGGRLIGIASGQGADKGQPKQGAYSAAKAGVVRLVESVAAEFEGRPTAHAIAPSTLLFDEDGDGVPAEQVVDLCVYLTSPAGAALNGATLRAYGA